MARNLAARQSRESAYVKFLKLNDFDAPSAPGWSGRGNHVEFQRWEDVPLTLGTNIGQGSYAVVQRVICAKINKRPLAQKIIWDYRKGGIEQVMTEVKCIQHLRHRHIVQLVGTYVVQRNLHILMFPVGQWNLRHFLEEFKDERMKSKAYPDFYSIGPFFKCLATGVAYLHDEVIPHIINLDIKPENIIVRRCTDRPGELSVFITDFGVSRSFQPSSPSTAANTLYTTAIYQAPEIAQGKEYGRKADIFSLGCVFSEMASIVAGKSLREYQNHRKHSRPGIEELSIAFESNLLACIVWLEKLKLLPPFKREPNRQIPKWWTSLLDRIEKMMSEDPKDRYTSHQLVNSFPSGPCCKEVLEEYQTAQKPQQILDVSMASIDNDLSSPGSTALTFAATELSDAFCKPKFSQDGLHHGPGGLISASHEVDLAPETEPELAILSGAPESHSSLPDFDWSGKGAHVQYDSRSEVPLEMIDILGMGGSSSVHKVKTKNHGSHIFAQKILRTRGHTLRMEMLMREAKLLQNLRNPHIVRLIGTTYDQRFFSILTYPAADWNLSDFMREFEGERSSRDAVSIERKQALYMFTPCLINALRYLHNARIRHKDIKPSNILVQNWPTGAHRYHVYLSDFGISTQIERDETTTTIGPTPYTARYAPPEIIFDEGGRNYKSDIFSMGCVWAEMYSVIIGERLDSLYEHLEPTSDILDEDDEDNGSEKSLGEWSDKETLVRYRDAFGATYATNLKGTVRWLHRLRNWCMMHKSLVAGESDNFSSLEVSAEEVIVRLAYIESMVELEPAKRPSATYLCNLLGANDCCTASTSPYDHEIQPTITNDAALLQPLNETTAAMEMGLPIAQEHMSHSPMLNTYSAGEFPNHSPRRNQEDEYPESTLPFSRDVDFVERGLILDRIYEKCATPGSRTALVGLGGVGKSQLAIEYAYRIRERSPKTWVFWVYGSNAARFEQSYRDIADRVKITGWQDPKANIFKIVNDWLYEKSKGTWILVLDNVDDVRFLLDAESNSQPADMEGASKPLREYLPQSQNGSILITSRNVGSALKLVGARDIITVGPMDEAQALTLLGKKLRVHGDSYDFAELAAALDYMPLAITQAAAYISQRAPRCSVRQYLEEFKKSDRKKTNLLNRDEGELRRDREAKNSIIITWQISFDYLHQTRQSAADLLSLMSFFDRQGIPEALLRKRSEQRDARRGQEEHDNDDFSDDGEDNASQSSASADEFEDDVVALRNFSFISFNADGTTFEMHALVQLAMRKWLEANKKLERWQQQFIRNLYAEFPTGEYENWAKCQALFAHVKSAAAQQPKAEFSLLEWATLLYHAAWYAWRRGNVTDAGNLAVKSMKVRRKVLGPEHKDTLSSMGMVGLAYELGGRWDAARELDMQVMEISKKKLGLDHLDTLTSMSNLASTYRKQGRWDAAEELFMQVVESRKKKLGADHPDTLTSVSNLALVLQDQGKYEAAEVMNWRALKGSEKVLGKDHPDTLTSMSNLASTYRKQGRWDAAEELFMEVVENRKKKLGADHPDTLTSVSNLALVLQDQGKYEAAEVMNWRALKGSEKVLGKEHPDTLAIVYSLAFLFHQQHRYEAALELYERANSGYQHVLRPEHPTTVACLKHYSSLKQEMRQS